MSGETVPYHLRQNKYIDRQLFVDVLSHVDRVRRIRQYLYISFGGAYLEDFKVIHSAFGNEKMLSIEELTWVYKRQKRNIPYGCIRCSNIKSEELLEQLDETRSKFGAENVLIWLDYAAAKKLRQQLVEFEAFLPKFKAFDIVRVTVNANPVTLGEPIVSQPPETKESLLGRRFETLRQRLGDFLPQGTSMESLTIESFPRVLLGAMEIAARRGMKGSPELVVQPLAVFTYKDAAHQMLTVTMIVLGRKAVSEFLKQSELQTYEFGSLDWKHIVNIDVPYLSVREKFYLDNVVFKKTHKRKRSRLISGSNLDVTLSADPARNLDLVRQYLMFYRQYPHYHRIHY